MAERPSSSAVGLWATGLVLGLVAGALAGLLRAPRPTSTLASTVAWIQGTRA